MTKFTSTLLGLTLVTLLPVADARADENAADEPQQTAFLNLFAPFRPAYNTSHQTFRSPYAYPTAARYGNTGVQCTNGRCYPTRSYYPPTSSCANGQCGLHAPGYCPNGQCGTGVGYRQAPVFQPTVAPYRHHRSNYVAPSTRYRPVQFNTTPIGTNYAPSHSNSPYFGGY